MSEELHGYLRHARDRILSQLNAFKEGRLEVWDIGVQPRVDVSQEHVDQLNMQLADTEALMKRWEVSPDA